jgi:hypothetical protein
MSDDRFLATLPPAFDELRALECDLALSNVVAFASSTVYLGVWRFA